MTAFKFIHAADIHLDSPLRGLERYEGAPVSAIRQASRRALENLISLALSESVSFVIIAGDLFDGDWRDYNTGLYFVQQMSRLNQNGIPVYLLKGNHDAANKLSKSLPLPKNVHVFSHKEAETFTLDELNVAIHGQSFATADTRDDLSASYPVGLSGKFNIGVLHTCLSGREGHDSYAPCKLEALKAKGYNYWALGHVHKREILCRNPLIVFPGNIQGRHIRETGEKGCSLVTVNERFEAKEEFCELAVMRWQTLLLDISGLEAEDELFSMASEKLALLLRENSGMPLALRVEIRGSGVLDKQIRANTGHFTQAMRALALQKGAEQVWLEKVKVFSEAESEQVHAEGPLHELLSIFDELHCDGELLSQLQEELQDLKTRLPAELIELRLSSSDDYLKESLKDVKQILLSRLAAK